MSVACERVDDAYEAGQCVRLAPSDALAPDEDIRHRRSLVHQCELGVQRPHLVKLDARVSDSSRIERAARLGREAALAPREDDHGRRTALADEPARRKHLANLRPDLVSLVLRPAAQKSAYMPLGCRPAAPGAGESPAKPHDMSCAGLASPGAGDATATIPRGSLPPMPSCSPNSMQLESARNACRSSG